MTTALVTGATGGVGAALAREFARAGAVAVHHRRSPEAAAALVAELRAGGARAESYAADLALDPDGTAARLLAAVEADLGFPDVVVLNAGSQALTPWDELDTPAWDALYEGTLRHTAALLHAAAARMCAGGAIVAVGSIEGLRAAPGHAAYAVFKAALHHLVAAAAAELGPRGIRVCGVAPGLVDRPGLARDWPDGHARFSAASALRRPVTPDEVASAAGFLASPAASGITGVVLPVDAGWSAAPGW